MHKLPSFLLLACAILSSQTSPPLPAQEQIDLSDTTGKGSAASANINMRVRVTQAHPTQESVRVLWRRGGEGLGGTVVRGELLGAENQTQVPLGQWTAWASLKDIIGTPRGWAFATLVASTEPGPQAARGAKAGPPLTNVVVEFEFATMGKTFRQFTEAAPNGATVGFAFPGGMLADKITPEFSANLNGVSGHARLRRERLEAAFPERTRLPKLFGIIGHIGGYGEGPPGVHGGQGFGTRHCNPEILKDEFRTMRLLGVNGLVDSLKWADAAGVGADLRHIFWGEPGSGSPMSFFQKGSKTAEAPEGCPYDPALKAHVLERTQKAIEAHKAAGAEQSWALWNDEIGVYAKEHLSSCERCEGQFRAYLQSQKVSLSELGAKNWETVKPYPIWETAEKQGGKSVRPSGLAPAPKESGEALRYYYSYRMMTQATGQVFSEPAKIFRAAGFHLYAMQGPTPSWNGASLDWHEFYDQNANNAFVFETSNRDARVWQWESYLADIGRGIATRHGLEQGCLIKPHRGAPAQRMLSVVSRGTSNFEWYTYGPDYSKGDSFSQNPELLKKVGHAARFLGAAEDFIYRAPFAGQPEVAFVSPRSSEIWSRVTDPSLTTFENAKWVYLALRHAHIPLDILGEAQLADPAMLSKYKVLYVPGTHLKRDASAVVRDWVASGGILWTDAMGLSRDESNQPNTSLQEVLGLGERTLETWGSVEQYRATELKPLTENQPPKHAALIWQDEPITARIGREALLPKTAKSAATFSDGKVALTRNQFGKGEAIVAGLWTGITYSAVVRRPDFDMHTDFQAPLRALISTPALERAVYRPAVASEPLLETVALKREANRSVALINWCHQRPDGERSKPVLYPLENVRIDLSGMGGFQSVRSLTHGLLKISNASVLVPRIEDIDLLILE